MELDYEDIRQKLNRDDEFEILDALSRIGGQTTSPPPADVVQTALSFLRHPDPDVRQEVVFSLGLHWTVPDAREAIVALVRTENDERVLAACVRSIGCYGEMAGTNSAMDQKALAEIVATEGHTDHVRGLAYVHLLRLAGRLEHQEMATIPEEMSQHDVDWDLIRRLCR